MARAITQAPSAHDNNFDGLRLIAALMVMVSHQFVFLHMHKPVLAGDISFGSVAVAMFFVMSGYMVTESWYRDPHLVRFMARRMLRIWPALFVATLVIALSAATISTLPLHAYFGHELGHFVTANARLHTAYTLPGVFFTEPFNVDMSAVNGSWWTIPLEVKCYLYLAVLGAIGLRRRIVSLIVWFTSLWLYARSVSGFGTDHLHGSLKHLDIAFFMTGVCARQFAEEVQRHRLIVLGVLAASLIGAGLLKFAPLAEWALVAPLTLWLGLRSTPGLRSAARFGDLSYSIYLYAFFVQQLTVHLWPAPPAYLPSIAMATLAIALVSWGSWHVVEAPALKLKRRLRDWFPDAAR